MITFVLVVLSLSVGASIIIATVVILDKKFCLECNKVVCGRSFVLEDWERARYGRRIKESDYKRRFVTELCRCQKCGKETARQFFEDDFANHKEISVQLARITIAKQGGTIDDKLVF